MTSPPPVARQHQVVTLRQLLRRLIWWCMLPLVLLAAWLGYASVRTAQTDGDRAAQALVSNTTRAVDQALRARLAALSVLAAAPSLDEPARWHNAYQQALSFKQIFGSDVILADLQGQMLFNTLRPMGSMLPRLPLPPHAAAPTAIATGQPAVGDVFTGPVSQRRMVALAVPVVRDGHVVKVLLSQIDLTQWQALLQEVPLPARWALTLHDGSGVAMASTGEATAPNGPPGGGRFSGHSQVAPWSVQLDIAADSYDAPIKAAAAALAAAIAGATLIGVMGGSRASRRLSRSMASLAGGPGVDPPGTEISEVTAVRELLAQSSRDRDAALDALRESEATFQAMFQGLTDAMLFVDIERHIRMANPAFTAIFGYGQEEVLGRTTEFLYADPADYAQLGRERYSPGATGSHQPYTMRYRRKNGSEFWGESSGMRVIDQHGQVLGLMGLHRDITERKRTEDQLHQSRAQLQAFIEQAPVCLAMFDREMNYLAASNEWLHQYGGGEPSLVGRNHYTLFAIPPHWKAAHDRALAGEAVHCDEDAWSQPDGGTVWLRWSVSPWFNEQGEVGGIMIATENITASKQAERSVQEAHERFATVFHSSPLGMAVGLLESGTFIDINASLLRMVGRTREEALGQSGAEITPWEDMAQRAAAFEQLRAGGVVLGLETRFRHTDGSSFEVEFHASRFEVGGVPHFLAMVSDVSLQKQAQRELARHHEELEALVAQRTAELAEINRVLTQRSSDLSDLYYRAPCGYFSLGRNRQIAAANDTLLRLLGYAREDLLGRPITDFMTAGSRDLFAERFARFLVVGTGRDLDYDFVHMDGRTVPVLVSADIERDAGGAFLAGHAMVVDNSERRAREQQIAEMQQELARRADDAEAATRAKSAFLANMSHEIRTPMNAIIGLTHLMARDAQDPLQRERLGKVDDSAKHLLQVINDILDLSKIEAGKMVLEDIEFSLDQMLAKVFEMVGGRAREKGLELVLDTDGLPSRLRGDPTRLSQALINLLANAVKFTEQGWVQLRCKLLAEQGPVLNVRFEVQDTGEGIEPERQTELFNAFAQADNSMSRRHGGTGLGLALTRHMAALMQGEVGLTSTPGQGSTFWMTARLGRATQAGDLATPIALGGLRALLVDDLPEALAALTDRLHALGLQVHACGSGEAAVALAAAELAAGHPYDVVLVDWRMAPMDGIATVQRLRQVLGAAMPPAVLVTAFDLPHMWQQARQTRVEATLVKPITASALHETLVRVIRRHAPAARALSALPGKAEQALLRRHAGQRVLLAEDNLINQEVAGELLRSVGLVVETANDGLRAVDLACSRSYDLVLMDVQMPELDGLVATQQIRAHLGPALPIVAMTANAFGEDRAACLAAGMNDHVAKPVDPEVLYATLLRWLPMGTPAPAPEGAGNEGQDEPALLHDRLAAIAGFDVETALRNVGGQMPALERILASFARNYRDGVPALLQAQSEDERPRWRTACHSLRGVCATVGAHQLLGELTALDFQLQEATPLSALAPAAEQVHQGLIQLARQLQAELDR